MKGIYQAWRPGLFFGWSWLPLDGYDVVDGIVAYTCKQREQATGRLRVKGSVAHVVWCDVSKSKQKGGASEIRAMLIQRKINNLRRIMFF